MLLVICFSTYIYADTTWTTGAYNNNEDVSQELNLTGANSLIVTVVGEVERNYDFIYIYDNTGNRIKRLHGVINEEFPVNGSGITARLVSDFSINRSGVTVTIVDANTSAQDTQKPVITLNGNSTVT